MGIMSIPKPAVMGFAFKSGPFYYVIAAMTSLAFALKL